MLLAFFGGQVLPNMQTLLVAVAGASLRIVVAPRNWVGATSCPVACGGSVVASLAVCVFLGKPRVSHAFGSAVVVNPLTPRTPLPLRHYVCVLDPREEHGVYRKCLPRSVRLRATGGGTSETHSVVDTCKLRVPVLF